MRFDVAVCGGGLAGLCVARQLHREVPEAKVAVLERSRRPIPEACHKVGESHVELSSHYLGKILGLEENLEARHLKKNGLRFLCGDSQGPIAARPEIGPAEFPLVPSYQIDRGRLESDLRALCEQEGVALLEGVDVHDIELRGHGDHLVRTSEGEVRARWVIDASGRRRLLQKKLGLRRESPVAASAAWFRVRDGVRIGQLVPESERQWHARDIDDTRWLSTVHLMGVGYWVWIIPLASGYTSVGVVANADTHAFRGFNTPQRMRAWLARHEPRLAERLADVPFEDFGVRHDYSYMTAQVLSAERWACVGEAAFFLDPLYSLGNDFLSMANSFAVRCIGDDLRGDLDPAAAAELEGILLLLAADSSRTLSGNSRIFGDADVLGTKVWWDFFNYWGFSCRFFFSELWREPLDELRRFRAMAQRWYDLNTHAQRVLEAWARLREPGQAPRKKFVAMPAPRTVLADLHGSLLEDRDAEAAYARMEADHAVGVALVTELLVQALLDLGPTRAAALGEAVGLGRDWTLPISPERLAAEGLGRRERLSRLPPVARDLQRAVGRARSDTALAELLRLAEGAREAAVMAPS